MDDTGSHHGERKPEGGRPAPFAGEEEFGVLLGWDAAPAGTRIALRMQSTRRADTAGVDVRDFRYFLTKEQAVQLGYFLYSLAGETPPAPRRAGLRRWLG